MLDIQLTSLVAAILCLGTGAWLMRSFNMSKRNPRGLPLPPGPRGLPFLGRARDMSKGKIWETFLKWSEQYGDIVYFEAMGQGILALNSLQSIGDLYETRGQNYSDRPRTPSLDMIEMDWNWGLHNYGSVVTKSRRVFHRSFGQREVLGYLPIVEERAAVYLQRLAKDPANFPRHTKDFFADSLIHISYGEGDEAWTKKMAERVEGVGLGSVDVLEPGRFLVDLIPLLRYVPTWFPGAGWKRRLKAFAAYSTNVYHDTFSDGVAHWRADAQGPHPNVLKTLFAELPSEEDPAYQSQVDLIKGSTFVAYLAGVDTQTSIIMGLILALAMHPEVQKKCHEELDTIIGPCRLPKPSDLAALHYVRAVIEEVLRWHVAVPAGLPHVVKEDDEYNGYFIPKGTLVFANNWAVAHNAAVYEEPKTFRPERHLKEGTFETSFLASEATAFGFGRRICPGRYMALGSLTFTAAVLMSMFDIAPAKDQDGNDIPLKYELEPVLVSNVLPFECDIVPRSETHAAIISDLQ